jgi:hypothetical protein
MRHWHRWPFRASALLPSAGASATVRVPWCVAALLARHRYRSVSKPHCVAAQHLVNTRTTVLHRRWRRVTFEFTSGFMRVVANIAACPATAGDQAHPPSANVRPRQLAISVLCIGGPGRVGLWAFVAASVRRCVAVSVRRCVVESTQHCVAALLLPCGRCDDGPRCAFGCVDAWTLTLLPSHSPRVFCFLVVL